MIGRTELAESARYSDALAEEHGYETLAELQQIDGEGLMYVAQQRALRAAMMMAGQDPGMMSRTKPTKIVLPREVQELLPTLTALAMDGIWIGIHAGRQDAG